MNYKIVYPNGSVEPTNSVSHVVSRLKSYGVSNLKRTPQTLKQVGTALFSTCNQKTIRVECT